MMDDEASDSDEDLDENGEDDYDDGFDMGLNDFFSVEEIDSYSATSSDEKSCLFDTFTNV